MLKLKPQYFGHLAQSFNSLDMSLSKLKQIVKDREAWHAACSAWGCKESDVTE